MKGVLVSSLAVVLAAGALAQQPPVTRTTTTGVVIDVTVVDRHVDVAGTQGVGDARRGDGAWTKDLEKQEQILTSRAAAVLGRLAKETGGFLLDNTNDLAAGVARMQQERTTYYLLGFQPTNTAADGKLRRVSMKVKRPRVTVRARPGYVAVR